MLLNRLSATKCPSENYRLYGRTARLKPTPQIQDKTTVPIKITARPKLGVAGAPIRQYSVEVSRVIEAFGEATSHCPWIRVWFSGTPGRNRAVCPAWPLCGY